MSKFLSVSESLRDAVWSSTKVLVLRDICWASHQIQFASLSWWPEYWNFFPYSHVLESVSFQDLVIVEPMAITSFPG